MEQKLVKCPVCKEQYWSHALKGHITNSGRGELWRALERMIDRAHNKPYEFSPAIVLRNSPHYAFRRRHIKKINKFII